MAVVTASRPYAPVVPDVALPVPATGAAAVGTHRRLGLVAIVVSAAAMGTAGLFGRMAAPAGAVVGEALTLGRMLVGALGMLVVLAATRHLGRLRRTRITPSVVLGGVLLGLSLATYLSSTVLIDLTLAVVLHYLGPVVATVLAGTVLKERVGATDVVSLVAAFAGMLLAAGLVGGPSRPEPDGHALGVGLGIASGVLYGGALLCYRYRTDMPSDVRSFWNFVFGAVGTGAMVAVTRPDVSGMTATHWAWAAAFFVVCGVLALSLLVVAGKHLRAVELSSLSYLEVVVAVLLGAAVFGEAVSAPAAAGVLLVVAAAVLPLLPRPRAGRERRAARARAAATTSAATRVAVRQAVVNTSGS
ncbi:DMT family transporter [Cellulomonas dongxiuzhuiae]|uniref:DMT family transporter n=1 Tax=Cellulomonas dongxiuzhuiae TaxID=2819979 RepID=UPI001AAF52AD|nr:DMT family transporter [Cellulomonas dongxiuzhuiae]MBO3089616.1 DMT family transporter [Cellulomonas dongxiuzhuiae]